MDNYNDNNKLILEFQNYEYFLDVLNYIKENHYSHISKFIDNIYIADNETFEKLLVSIIREKLLPFTCLSLKPHHDNSFTFSTSNGVIQEISFKINTVYGFDFFTFNHPIYYVKDISSSADTEEVDHSLNLIEILKQNKSYPDIDKFKMEIVNSITNKALISTLSNEILSEIKDKGNSNNWKYLSDYVDDQLKINPLFDKFLFYDQLHINGHHIHPSFKLRLGLSCEEVIKYSYELKNQLPIRLIGLHRSVGRFSLIDNNLDPSDYFLSLFSSMKQPIEQYCNDIGVDIKEYLICPMYPFQVTNTFPNQFKEELSNKILILFPDSIQVPSFPTASLRNLIPKIIGNENPPHIKFSVPIQLTNFVRFMPNDFIPVGTTVSRLLEIISKLEESTFKNKIIFLNELGGIYHSNTELRYQNFAIIWKEDVNLFLQSKEDQPISSCSLFNPSPISPLNVSILGELIHQYLEYHCTPKGINQQDGIRKWFQKYTRLLLYPNIVLFSKYGVALESHLQNSVYIYQKGEPLFLAHKDWSGIRIKTDRLMNHTATIPEQLIKEIPDEVKQGDMDFYKMFSHSILHNHICQIIIGICKDFSIDEKILWKDVYDIFQSILKQLCEEDPSLKHQITQDESLLFAEQIKCKALTGMRLLTNNTILLPFLVLNPLYEFTKQ